MKERILLEELLQSFEKELQKAGLTKGSIAQYRCQGIYPYREYYHKAGMKFYDRKFNEQIISETESKSARGLISPKRMWAIRKVALLLDGFNETGEISQKRICSGSKVKINSTYYSDILQRFREAELNTGLRTKATIIGEMICLMHFFSWLENNGYSTLIKIDLKNISQYLTYFSLKNPGSMDRMTGVLRKLYAFLQRCGIPTTDFSPALVTNHSKRRKLRPVISNAETENIMSLINTTRPIGKRDYAILTIAKSLGIRGGDIIDLKLSDINWRTDEIMFRQNKTGIELTLPLTPVVGNAIADYILNGRPKTEANHIFVRHIVPIKKLDNSSNIFRRYASTSRIEKWAGFHSFRRSVASRMLNTGIEPDTVKNFLGQTKIDSLKPYFRISDIRLKSCTLTLFGIETSQEELL
ncbi:MAG: tyrosine-type recombinase/integrase [Tannerellaceae bacterium]|jgi:site-specific recombinase XerD|nr:tyrosine-type recombinase/integrase [Tannerellaceae bacterium]